MTADLWKELPRIDAGTEPKPPIQWDIVAVWGTGLAFSGLAFWGAYRLALVVYALFYELLRRLFS